MTPIIIDNEARLALTQGEHKAQEQAIFDYAVDQLASMTKRSVKGVSCSYMICNDEGEVINQCIFGRMMTEDELEVIKEGCLLSSSALRLERDGVLPARFDPHLSLITDLQRAHDSIYNWSEEGFDGWDALVTAAKMRGLDQRRLLDQWKAQRETA